MDEALTGEDFLQRFQFEIPAGRHDVGLVGQRLVSVPCLLVFTGRPEPVADDLLHPHAALRVAVAEGAPVAALDVLAQGELDPRLGLCELERLGAGAPPQLDDLVLAPDGIGRTVQHVGHRESSGQFPVHGDIVAVDHVSDAHLRGHGLRTFVDALQDSRVRMGVDDAGRDVLAGAVDLHGAVRRHEGRADFRDLAVADQHVRVIQLAALVQRPHRGVPDDEMFRLRRCAFPAEGARWVQSRRFSHLGWCGYVLRLRFPRCGAFGRPDHAFAAGPDPPAGDPVSLDRTRETPYAVFSQRLILHAEGDARVFQRHADGIHGVPVLVEGTLRRPRCAFDGQRQAVTLQDDHPRTPGIGDRPGGDHVAVARDPDVLHVHVLREEGAVGYGHVGQLARIQGSEPAAQSEHGRGRRGQRSQRRFICQPVLDRLTHPFVEFGALVQSRTAQRDGDSGPVQPSGIAGRQFPVPQ